MNKIKLCIILGIFIILHTPCFAQEHGRIVYSIGEANVLYRAALIAKQEGDLLRSRKCLAKIINYFPKYAKIEEVKKEWGRITFFIIRSRLLSSESVLYTVLPGDTLEKIAKKHHTTIELIKKRNGLKENRLKDGQVLSIWNYPFTILVDKASNLLWLKLNKNVVKQYRVSTGKAETTTPVGNFTIKYRYPSPTWFHRGEIIQGGSVDNWLGTRWLGFDKPKYGIHGTIYPQLIGQSVSGGCVRMKNRDVEELYQIIPLGTKVTVIDSRADQK